MLIKIAKPKQISHSCPYNARIQSYAIGRSTEFFLLSYGISFQFARVGWIWMRLVGLDLRCKMPDARCKMPDARCQDILPSRGSLTFCRSIWECAKRKGGRLKIKDGYKNVSLLLQQLQKLCSLQSTNLNQAMGIECLQTDRPAKRCKSLRYHIHCDGLQWPAFILPPHPSFL